MKAIRLLAGLLLFSLFSSAQIYLPPGGYIQDFTGLATTGAGNLQSTLPTGWAFREVGTVPNGMYRGDDGTDGGGDTYSYGPAGNSERALGSIASDVCRSTFGATFVNTTGAPIRTIRIRYYAEQWHTGWFSRFDSTLFSYAIGNSFQYAATWTRVPQLDMITNKTGGNFKLDGNLSANRRLVEYTLSGVEVATDDTFSIRWQDLDRAGSNDDGVAVDDFSITVAEGDEVAPVLLNQQPLSGSYVTTAALSAALNFSEPVNLGSGSARLLRFPEGTVVRTFTPGDGNISASDTTVHFGITGLEPGIRYSLEVDSGLIEDASGNGFPGIGRGEWIFARRHLTDGTRPSIDTLQPRHNYSMATNYPVFRIFFSEPVRRGFGAFHLRRAADGAIHQSFAADTLEISGRMAVLRPSFLPEGNYYITADSAVVEDTAANAFRGISAGRWHVGISNILGVPIDNHALTVNTRVPGHRAFGAAPSRLEIYWYEYVLEGLGHIRIRNSATDAIVHEVPVTDASVSSSQNLTTITLPVLPAGTYYVEIEEGAFTNIPGTEFKGYGKGAWQFTVTGQDGRPLHLNRIDPVNRATQVARNSRFFLYFNKSLRDQTTAVTIHRFDNNAFFTTADVSVRDTMVVLTPHKDLDWGTEYYIEVPAAHFNDLGGGYGNGPISKAEWSFTTVPPPSQYNFDLTCPGFGLPAGFTSWNSEGAAVWNCGTASDTAVLRMEGRTNGTSAVNTDWLISPVLDLRSMQMPALRFLSHLSGGTSRLRLLVSTNYSGTGNPGLATWTEINAALPDTLNGGWTLSDSIPLTRWKGQYTHLAWRYENGASEAAARWMISAIAVNSVTGTGGAPSLTTDSALLSFGFSPNGAATAPRSVMLQATNAQTSLQAGATSGFEISTNGVDYAQSASFPAFQLHKPLRLFVRFRPTAANQEFTGELEFAADGVLLTRTVALTGNSMAAVTGLPYIDPAALGSGIVIYGNPAKDIVQVKLRQPVAGRVEARLVDGAGKLWWSGNVSGSAVIRIPAGSLPRGVYMISIRSGNRTAVQKILLQ